MTTQLLDGKATERPMPAPVRKPRRVWSSNPAVVLWGSPGPSARRIRPDRRSPEDGPDRRRCELRVPALGTESPVRTEFALGDNPWPPPLPMASAARKPAPPERTHRLNPFATSTCIAQQARGKNLNLRNASPLVVRLYMARSPRQHPCEEEFRGHHRPR
jgi:hypothetical protein